MTPRSFIAAALSSIAMFLPFAALAAETDGADGRSMPVPAASANAKASDRAKDFGPNGPFYSNVDSHSLVPFGDAMLYTRSGSGGFLCNVGSTQKSAVGQIHLPHGVQADFFRVWMFDTDAGEDMTVTLEEHCLPDFGAAFPTSTALASVTSSGSGGVISGSDSFATGPRRIDNTSCTYRVQVRFGAAGGNCTQQFVFYKARIEWERIAPPAPVVATFSDVPTTHPFFQQIEALAESGITLGCTGSTYCPDSTVTRAQMAAFLVRALALQPGFFADPANP